jgi:hypothetical protein
MFFAAVDMHIFIPRHAVDKLANYFALAEVEINLQFRAASATNHLPCPEF